jgi:pyridoxamine 5'-phosphate oxidase
VALQTAPVESRDFLERRFQELDCRFSGGEVLRPETWTGFRIRPDNLEFWQGREDRLHDRIRYVRRGDGWVIERLAP